MKSLNFGKEEALKTLKVFGWTVASAFVVLLIDLVGVIEMPAEYAFIIPVTNTVLYAVKEWVADNQI